MFVCLFPPLGANKKQTRLIFKVTELPVILLAVRIEVKSRGRTKPPPPPSISTALGCCKELGGGSRSAGVYTGVETRLICGSIHLCIDAGHADMQDSHNLPLVVSAA